MASSPPASPLGLAAQPVSALAQVPRSSSRMSVSSKHGGGSRHSEEDGSRTSVKVAVRVRPPLKSSDPGYDLIPQRFQRSILQVITPTSLAIESPQARKLFIFDKVFGEDIHQDGVWEYVNESVDSFVQGYNVSVLAYGQSGSGKSYTMGTSGPVEQSDIRIMGVIPRAATALFNKLAGPPTLARNGSSSLRTPTRYSLGAAQNLASLAKISGDKSWQMKATYVEIYNEQLRDLLVPESVPQGERATVAIREDVKGRILLTGLHQVEINSVEDLLGALNFGSSIRQTDATAINAISSRSHAVFSINLIQRKNTNGQTTSAQEKRFSMPIEAMTGAENWVTIDSKLHFVDLAGSERLKNSGATGDRAREGISINAGLASLGKVISQLSSRQPGSHVSYRDSKLTRLLQDSLGGNAITYMIACVTPAEFHLSETLNTVQYAQRARAIQSKPRIHQVSDESDKQAVIDRLRAEVSFLRDQICSSERGDRRSNVPQDRTERQNEREIELQNHLLNVQENYTALGHRHAKLISEITKARNDDPGETPTLTGAIGDTAVERLKRSNSFAEAVEQVVLEYEKTIQSLETSLSATRSSLATTENSLMERENKCAYVETVNQQLQNRLQKMVDRESSTESYLHDLEARLDGHSSGEEKNSNVVTELRKEIARIRENETGCEDYISTLEERLAESDQDMELMQREVDRLEHVVARQRSLGKLDNLLYEFDHIEQNGKHLEQKPPTKHLTNGFAKSGIRSSAERARSDSILLEAAEIPIPDFDDDEWENPSQVDRDVHQSNRAEDDGADNKPRSQDIMAPLQNAATAQSVHQSPAQSEFLADKLEIVTQELVDLRVEHDSTVTQIDMMSAKYEEALRTLAEFQGAIDDEAHQPGTLPAVTSPAPTRPTSFLEDAKVNGLKDGEHLPSPRSLSSELSLDGDSASSVDPHPAERPLKNILPASYDRTSQREETPLQEMDHLISLLAEKDQTIATSNGRYAHLEELHLETLDIIEELKAEVTKAKMNNPNSSASPVIRRKSSVMTIDRAHRSLASLRNIAADNLEDKPDTMQNFELNLNTAMHELHQRSERVQVLEAELASVRKEMETKMAMITGLTRERSSLKATSPMDISVVSQMHAQLLQTENQVKALQEEYADRERDLVDEVESLRRSLDDQVAATRSSMPGFFPETPAPLQPMDEDNKQLGGHASQSEDNMRLREELKVSQNMHQAAVDTMQASEKNFIATIAELQSSMGSVEAMRNTAFDQTEIEKERDDLIEAAKVSCVEIDEQRATIDSHLTRIAELEEMQVSFYEEFESTIESQLVSHRDQISLLRQQIQEHQSAVEFHKHGLKSLHDTHANELVDLRARAKADMEQGLAKTTSEKDSQFAMDYERFHQRIDELCLQLQEHRGLQDEKEEQIGHLASELQAQREQTGLKEEQLQAQRSLIDENAEQRRLTESRVEELAANLTVANSKIANLAAEIDQVSGERDRATRLVEELEEQISASYDHQRATSSRLSVLSSTRENALQEANLARSKLEEDLEEYRNRLEQAEVQIRASPTQVDVQHPDTRTNSMTSNFRRSVAVATLPSPPPAIPLPPLPTNIPNLISSTTNPNPNPLNSASPTQHDHISAQYVEDQEARLRTIEKHLFAEKQLTATLEEALVDLEHQGNKVKGDMDVWKKKAWAYEDELANLRKERNSTRHSQQVVEEERNARKEAEAGVARLEERMQAMNRKKKKSGFNCF